MASPLGLRVVGVIQHVFAEVALLSVRACAGVGVLSVAIPAAGDILRRADRDIIGAAERIVIDAGVNHRWLTPLKAAREQWRNEHEQTNWGLQLH
jgi:hypothetical protein